MGRPKKENGEKNTPEVDLERLFRELDTDGSVSVSRKEPDWARGHIRTVQISAKEPISMEWLTSKFGGQKIQVRVYAADNKTIIGNRTVEICAPPRNGYGIELVRGPEGDAVPVTRLGEAQKRYRDLHGLPYEPEPAAAAGTIPYPYGPPPPAQPPIDFSTILTTMIGAQNKQNEVMITMLTSRIGTLETLLSQQLASPPAVHPPAGPAEPYDPLGNLKNTVDTIGQLEKVKEAMGIADRQPESETGVYTELIKGFLELELEKQRAKSGPAALPPGDGRGRPALPGPPPIAAAPAAAVPEPGRPGTIDDQTLMSELSSRFPAILEAMTPEQRLSLAETVLGEPIDDGYEDDEDDGDQVDPPKTEKVQRNGQPDQNSVNLRDNDQTGAESTSCTRAAKEDDPPIRIEP